MSAPSLAVAGPALARRHAGFGVAGAEGTRLLGGPGAEAGAESLEEHVHRLGALDLATVAPEVLRSLVRSSGLLGRGGGQFPLARKLDLAAQSPGVPVVVVNASEGEPASSKDQTLLRLRPHLVLDGAEAVAAAVGAVEITIYHHSSRRSAASAVELAVEQRRRARSGRRDGGLRLGPTYHVVDAPDRYVAGEASAVVSFLDGRPGLPARRALPPAAAGVGGRPTVVSNTETYAHVGLLTRFGVPWFRSAGSPGSPGSSLLTLAGAVPVPGTVVEVVRTETLGEILASAAGLAEPPRAVLLGGYGGTWIDGRVAWTTPVDRHALQHAGAPLGCGLVAVLGNGSCGIAETARLLGWMAEQSAGQCGPCALGLPRIAELAGALAGGRASRRQLGDLRRLAASVRGRGACGHPTGAVGLLESALDTFAEELRHHLRGSSCRAAGAGLPTRADRPEQGGPR